MSIYRLGMVSMPTDTYTKLLLHCDGANGFTDECGKAVTVNGNCQLSTAQSMFGGTSGKCEGGDYLRLSDSPDFDFGTGNFTIDCWVRFLSMPTGNTYPNQVPLFCDGPANDSNQNALYIGSTTIRFCTSDSVAIVSGNHGMAINTWYHVACVRNGNSWNIYINGTSVAAATNSVNLPTYTGYVDIMADDYGASAKFNGYFDEYRISKGIARWTANFTPPTSAYVWSNSVPTNTNVEIKTQYRGLGGVNREIREQYRGFSGVNRKVFSGLTVWKKYNVTPTYAFSTRIYEQRSFYSTGSITVTCYASTIEWVLNTLSGDITSTGSIWTGLAQNAPGNCGPPSQSTRKYFKTGTSICNITTETVYYNSPRLYVAGWWNDRGSGNPIKGSYITDVTSSNSSAYPDDGIHSDSYWYVKQ